MESHRVPPSKGHNASFNALATVLTFLMTFEPQCQAWKPLADLELS